MPRWWGLALRLTALRTVLMCLVLLALLDACLSQGQRAPPPPAQTCQAPSVQHGSLSPAATSGQYSAGQHVSVSCDYNYVFSGTSSRYVHTSCTGGQLTPRPACERMVLTDANFKRAVRGCLGEDPVAGNCSVDSRRSYTPFGPISGWDTSRVTDMSEGTHPLHAITA
eukprot:SAG31_NODE_5299_length_2624_cov_2.500990_2_plen_168_part_00